MLNKTNKIRALTIVALAAALTACGGGGGGDGSATSPTPVPTTPTPVAPPINSGQVTTVPAPTYAAASEEVLAFNLLNAERNRCGFGLLAQNTQLDVAAKGHADWQLVNNFASHNQVPATPLFTGVTPDDRILAAGYGTLGAFSGADEFSTVLGTSAKLGMGESRTRELLNAPYHMKALAGNFRDIGISVRNSIDTASAHGPRVAVQFNLAYKMSAGPQLSGGGDVQTYPCGGSTGIKRLLSNESPNPVPGRDLAINPLGSSIYIAVREGQTLAITSANMIKVATGAAVTLRPPVTSANDPYAPCTSGCYKSHEAYIAADAPLDANAQYQVTVNGTNSGTAFSRTFSFTTGS